MNNFVYLMDVMSLFTLDPSLYIYFFTFSVTEPCYFLI